jgi:RNA polymerase sigma factor (sigma-70 family)
MPGGPTGVVVKDIQTLFRVGTAAGLSDGQLLDRFLTQRGDAAEAAFTALVERHAPMVLRICRDSLHDWHDAEDASQATFIVLARKASSIRKLDSIASWLFGVACRVAAQARSKAARRQRHERRNAELTAAKSVADDDPRVPWFELYEEIDRLPERLRGPLVLCYLKGYSQPEAAARLGCPVRTLQNRLTRGRDRLRSRLTAHDVYGLVGLQVAPNSSRGASLPVSAAWLETTVRAARETVHHAPAATAISASVAALTEGMLRMMLRTKLKSIVGAGLLVGILAVGMGLLVHGTAVAERRNPRPVEETVAPPSALRKDDPPREQQERTAEIIVRAAEIARLGADDGLTGIVAIDPKTAKWRPIFKGLSMGPGPLSPDGRYIVYSSLGPDPDADQLGIWIYEVTGESAPRRIFERKGTPHWSNHGQKVVISVPVGQTWGSFETWRASADGTGRVKLPIPETDLVLDCARDGAWLATRTISGEATHKGRLTLVHPDGTGARVLTEGSANDDFFSIFRISPDGRFVAYVEIKTKNEVGHSRLFVVDIDGKHRREIPAPLSPGITASVCWSPDGSRLALDLLDSRTKEGSIAVVDLDGSNFRTLPLPPGRWNILLCDWSMLTPAVRVGSHDQTLDLKTPRGRYEALLEECNQASQAFQKEYRKATTDEDRRKITGEKSWQPRRYLGRFLAIAESAPDDPAAVDALLWVVQFGSNGPEFTRAIDQLVQNHAGRRKVGLAASSLVYAVSPSVEKLVRAVIDKSPDQPIKAMASLALGRFLKQQSLRVRDIRESPESVQRWATMFLEEGEDKESFAQFIARDPDVLMKEAGAVFETVKEFADKSPSGKSLSTDARAELYEIRNLCVGKPAPEIVGQDFAGKPLKLSDFKGKVVVVDFWSTSCGACRHMNAYERSLTTRMQGKPFALLGVNCDAETDKLAEWIKKERITWPSWHDGNEGNASGPIFRQFNIQTWPTLYVLDNRGFIRHKFLGFPGDAILDPAIDALVKETD